MKDFKVGDVVFVFDEDVDFKKDGTPKYNEYLDVYQGKITKIENGIAHLKWSNEHKSNYSNVYELDQLMYKEEVDKIMTDLAADFDNAKKLIQERAKDIEAALKDAGTIAENLGYTLQELANDIIESGLDSAGWRSSSFYC